MKHVGIVEAQGHLSDLVQEVQNGGEVVLTRDGKPVAKLVRPTEVDPAIVERRRQALRELREMAKKRGLKITPEEIKEWINEGRP